jgi:hypothetical protein
MQDTRKLFSAFNSPSETGSVVAPQPDDARVRETTPAFFPMCEGAQNNPTEEE